MKKIFVLTTLIIFAAITAICKEIIRGKVVKVSDGDTITILTDDFKQIKIRLHGIDCPENGQDFGNKAKQFTSDLCFGKQVQIEARDIDRYGRIVGLVILPDGKVVNEELLSAGLAWHYKRYDKSQAFADLELSARVNKVGIWSINNPTPPWKFRKVKNQKFVQHRLAPLSTV